MSIELARRLLRGELIPAEEVERALEQALERHVSLVTVLYERGADVAQRLEHELERSPLPTIRTVRGLPELVNRLPSGICERLLAVPVREDGRTGTIDVVAVDPFDAHVASEFGFHLRATVRVLRAGYADVTSALAALRAAAAMARPADAFKRLGSHPSASRIPLVADAPRISGASEPPIPLIRKSLSPKRPAMGTDPGVGPTTVPVLQIVTDDDQEEEDDLEPVLDLSRPKSSPRSAFVATEAAAAPSAANVDLESALEALARTRSPDEVIGELVDAVSAFSPRVLVLSVKGQGYEGRAASRAAGGTERARSLRIAGGGPSVLETAVGAGSYLGPIPESGEQTALAKLLVSTKREEAYLVPVDVKGRAALILAAAGFDNTFQATERCDRLAKAAGAALERILIERKRVPTR